MHSPIWRRSVYKVLAKWYSVTWQDEVIYLVPCLYIVVYTHLSRYAAWLIYYMQLLPAWEFLFTLSSNTLLSPSKLWHVVIPGKRN